MCQPPIVCICRRFTSRPDQFPGAALTWAASRPTIGYDRTTSDVPHRRVGLCRRSAAIAAATGGLSGIRQLDFDVLHARLTVEYDAEAISPAGIVQQMAGLGMQASLWHPRDAGGARDEGRRRLRWLLVTLSGVACCAGFLVHAWCAGSLVAPLGPAGETPAADIPWPAQGCYLLSILIGLWYVAPRAWSSLRRLRTDMNVLMCAAVAGAVGIGQWLEASTVTFLFALALLLEHWAMAHARRAIGALLSLTPPTARCLPAANASAEGGQAREGAAPAEPSLPNGSAGAAPSQAPLTLARPPGGGSKSRSKTFP